MDTIVFFLALISTAVTMIGMLKFHSVTTTSVTFNRSLWTAIGCTAALWTWFYYLTH